MRTASRTKSIRLALLTAVAVFAFAPASAQAAFGVLRLKNQPQTARAGGAAIKLYDGRVLTAAGETSDGSHDSYDIFDPAGDSGTGSWTHHVGMNGGSYNIANAWWHSYMFNLGGPHHKVLLIGKEGPGTDAGARYMSQVYDPVDDTWSAPVHTGRSWTSGCAQSTDGVIACSVNGLSVYEPGSDTWRQTTIDSGWWPSSIAGLDNGKFLVVTNNSWPDYNNAYVFDSNDDSWTATGGAPHTLIDATMFQLPNKKVLTVGGSTDSNNVNVANTYLWDPATGQWSTAGYVTGTETAQPLSFWGASQDSSGNVFYSSPSVSLAKFDVSTGAWDPAVYHQAGYNSVLNAQDPRAVDRSIPLTLDDGRTLVFGGGGSWYTTGVYTYGNVPVVTAQPVLSAENINTDDTVSVTTDATWDTDGLVINKRWQRCTSGSLSTCVDFAGNSASSYTFTLDDFKAGYRVLRRIETVQDPTVGTITASTLVYVYGPSAPSANPVASVNFDSSSEYAAGAVLTRTQGTWSGHNLGSVTAKWQRCGDFGNGYECQDLADAATYTVTQEDIDGRVLIKYIESVTDDLDQTSTSEQSGYINPISPPTSSCCVDAAFPSSSMTENVPAGQTVTVDTTSISWNHTPDLTEYRWQVYDQDEGDWVDINGATTASLDTTGITPGSQLRLMIRGTKDGTAGEWNQISSVYTSSNIWTPDGVFYFNEDSKCNWSQADNGDSDIRLRGDCSVSLDDARYWVDGSSHSDAFDGAWQTWIGADDGTGNLVYQTANDNQYSDSTPWKTLGAYGTDTWTSGTWGTDEDQNGLHVGVRYRPSKTIDLMAKVIKLTNTTADPMTRVIAESGNFGSDSSTQVHGQSSGGSDNGNGGLVFDPNAFWYTTADNAIGDGEAGDAVNTTVFGGPGASALPSSLLDEDDVGTKLTVEIPAGETRYVLFFMGLGSMKTPTSNDPATAVTNAQSLFNSVSTLPQDLLVDIPSGDRAKVVNWQFVPPVVAPSLSFKGWGTTASGLAKFTVGGPAGSQIEVSNYANFKGAVSVGVGKWGSIKTLATKLGAGQVRVYYRVKGQPSSAASTLLKYDFYTPFIIRNSVHWSKTVKATWNIHLLARDKTCPGCSDAMTVQIAYGKTRPAASDPFPTTLGRDVFAYRANSVVKAPTPPRWARVSDANGNVSAWRALVGAPAYPAG